MKPRCNVLGCCAKEELYEVQIGSSSKTELICGTHEKRLFHDLNGNIKVLRLVVDDDGELCE